MKITVEGTLFRADLPERMQQSAAKVVKRMTDDALAIMKQRTLDGQSVDGGAFEDYSDSYKDFLIRKKQPLKVDLFLSGIMSGGWAVLEILDTGTSVQGIIGFISKEAADRAVYNSVKRPFIGLRPQDEVVLMDLLDQNLRFDEINQ